MNIITKSGTNNIRGSFFELFRDDFMNAKTFTEKRNNAEKQEYRRNQFGGSFGGPVIQDRLHYFAAVERTQQDTFQVVNTQGLFPEVGRHLRDAVPRDAAQRQGDGQPQPEQLPVGPLRAQLEQSALQRRRQPRPEQLGRQRPTSSTRSTRITTGW